MRYFHFMMILIFSGVAQKRRVTAVEGYREKTVNHSIRWGRAILCSVTIMSHSPYRLGQTSRTKGRATSSLNAKFLVLLRTSRFATQCIARAIKHLPVTHLEIVTLAYAAMNFVIYIFWWNKALNVNWPVRVFRNRGQRRWSLDESWQRTNLKRAGNINRQWLENNIFLYHRFSG